MNRGFKAIIAFWTIILALGMLTFISPHIIIAVALTMLGSAVFIAAFTLIDVLIWDKFKDKEDK